MYKRYEYPYFESREDLLHFVAKTTITKKTRSTLFGIFLFVCLIDTHIYYKLCLSSRLISKQIKVTAKICARWLENTRFAYISVEHCFFPGKARRHLMSAIS